MRGELLCQFSLFDSTGKLRKENGSKLFSNCTKNSNYSETIFVAIAG